MIKAWCRLFTSLNKMLVEVFKIKASFRMFTSVNKKQVKVSWSILSRIGTSSALARNETRLVSPETSLARNETRLARPW